MIWIYFFIEYYCFFLDLNINGILLNKKIVVWFYRLKFKNWNGLKGYFNINIICKVLIVYLNLILIYLICILFSL